MVFSSWNVFLSCWNILGLLEYFRPVGTILACWYNSGLLEYVGICWNMSECVGICWNNLVGANLLNFSKFLDFQTFSPLLALIVWNVSNFLSLTFKDLKRLNFWVVFNFIPLIEWIGTYKIWYQMVPGTFLIGGSKTKIHRLRKLSTQIAQTKVEIHRLAHRLCRLAHFSPLFGNS